MRIGDADVDLWFHHDVGSEYERFSYVLTIESKYKPKTKTHTYDWQVGVWVTKGDDAKEVHATKVETSNHFHDAMIRGRHAVSNLMRFGKHLNKPLPSKALRRRMSA